MSVITRGSSRSRQRRAISPPTLVICAPYFFTILHILLSAPTKKQSISPPTLVDAPPVDDPVNGRPLSELNLLLACLMINILQLRCLLRMCKHMGNEHDKIWYEQYIYLCTFRFVYREIGKIMVRALYNLYLLCKISHS